MPLHHKDWNPLQDEGNSYNEEKTRENRRMKVKMDFELGKEETEMFIEAI